MRRGRRRHLRWYLSFDFDFCRLPLGHFCMAFGRRPNVTGGVPAFEWFSRVCRRDDRSLMANAGSSGYQRIAQRVCGNTRRGGRRRPTDDRACGVRMRGVRNIRAVDAAKGYRPIGCIGIGVKTRRINTVGEAHCHNGESGDPSPDLPARKLNTWHIDSLERKRHQRSD